MTQVTREELIELIEDEDWKAVGYADVSGIVDMSNMVNGSKFNGDIERWLDGPGYETWKLLNV